jgi:hypothetical protein
MKQGNPDSERHVSANPIGRRTLLVWGGALGAAAALRAGTAGAASPSAGQTASQNAARRAASPDPALLPMDARGVELYMKLHASTADGEVPWYYTGRIYGIRDREAPRHLFNFEGTEIYWVRRTGEAEWTTTSSTLTFFRDPVTGRYLDEYANPFTGRTVPVKPNVLRSGPGRFSRFSPRGYELSPEDMIPWSVELQRNGGVLWLTSSRYLARAPQPWLEVQTMLAQESDLADAKIARPATTFSSSYVAPWLRWLDMGDAPGHMLWHAAGRKLATNDELPPAYRERAERLQPGHFVAPGAA